MLPLRMVPRFGAADGNSLTYEHVSKKRANFPQS